VNILVLSPYAPYPPDEGGRRRTFHIIETLQKNHMVDLITFSHDKTSSLPPTKVQVERVPFVGRPQNHFQRLIRLFQAIPDLAAKHHRPEMTTAYQQHYSQKQPDLIWVEESPMMMHVLGTSIPIILNEHNIESELWRQEQDGQGLRDQYELFRLQRYENMVWRKAAAVGVVSYEDERIINHRAPECQTVVLANGVDTNHFQPQRNPSGPILIVGTLNHAPNRESIDYFITRIWPILHQQRPELKVLISGKFTDSLRSSLPSGITAAGLVPDVREIYNQGSILAVPLLHGGGSRLKILEAWASGLPVVSTTIGAAGLRSAQQHLKIADTPDTFCTAILDLLDDRAQADRLAHEARTFAITEYDWSKTLAPLLPLIESIGDTHALTR